MGLLYSAMYLAQIQSRAEKIYLDKLKYQEFFDLLSAKVFPLSLDAEENESCIVVKCVDNGFGYMAKVSKDSILLDDPLLIAKKIASEINSNFSKIAH